MLHYKLLKNYAGFELIGDETSLKALYELLHRIDDLCPLLNDRDGPLLALAFDLRKAFTGQRQITKSPPLWPSVGPVYGVGQLWPIILFQARFARLALAYVPHTPLDQRLILTLESVVRRAVQEAFGGHAAHILDVWSSLDAIHPDAFGRLDPLGAIFCALPPCHRKSSLANLLLGFSPLFQHLHDAESRRAGSISLIPHFPSKALISLS